jgi:hypothetical protein
LGFFCADRVVLGEGARRTIPDCQAAVVRK